MKKFTKIFALLALLIVPWAASAQSGCTIRVAGTDSYGDGWNGGSLDISQGGTSLSTFALSGASDEVSITLPTNDPVTFTWTSGSYDYEVTINIYDGGNTLVETISTPSAGVIYTMSSPCPSCLPATGLTATYVTTDGMTVSWTDATNSGSYTLSYWKNGGDTTTVNLTTTSYTLTGLDANSYYNFSIVTNCSATEESSPLSGGFATACNGSTCELTVSTSASYFSSYYLPTVTLYQNGINLGSVQGSAQTIEVCSTDTVKVIYTEPNYSYGPSVTILDAGGVGLFNGSTDSYSDGDVLANIATPCPTCIPPTALTVVPDSNQIDFSWTPRSGASQFIVYLNDSLVDDNVTDTFYTFMGLPANTPYSVKVQSVCSADDSSSIVSVNTRTACGQITLPYSVDFEDAEYNGAWYPCWDSVIHAGTDPSVNTTASHNSTYGMYFQANSSEAYNLVVSPQVPTAGNNIYVRFWGYNTNTTWFKAGIISDPHDSSTFIPLVDIMGNTWQEYEFRTDTVTGIDASTNYYIAWMAYKPGVSYNTQMGRMDDVYISEIPSCVRVSSIDVDTITDESITLTWVDNSNNSASYTVSYWSATSDTNSVTTSDTSYYFGGLNSNTSYTFSVQANCGSEDAEAVTASFRTACGLTMIPYLEDFEDEGSLSCWQRVSCAGGTDRYSSSSYAHSGNASFRFNYNSNPPQYLISPELTGTDAGVKVEFWYKEYMESYPESFKVGYSLTGDSTSAFIWGEEINNVTTSYQLFSAIYPAGTKFVAIQYTANDQYYLYIDDINFMLPPDCMPVSLLYVDSIVTDNSATIHWTAPENQNSFIVRLNDSVYFNTTDTFYTFNGLAERTLYNVAVATDCSGDTSEWVSTSFVTGCAGGECEVTVVSSSSYINYAPTLHVYQNGVNMANVLYSTEVIGVCTGMPVTVIYEAPAYSYGTPYATIINGGDEEVFNDVTSDYSTGDTLVYMANACPSCLKPSGLVPSVVDSNEITFVWTVESGITYLVSFDDAPYTVNNSGTYTAYGLDANTLYTFSVKAVCAPGDTSNARTVSVKSACGEMVIPYVEDFEGDSYGDVPSCWTVVSNGYNGFPKIDDNGNNGSDKSLTFVSDSYGTAMIASSRIPLPGDSIKVSFWAREYNYSTSTFEVGMMTNPYVDSSFISLDTLTPGNDYVFYEFNTNALDHDSTYYLAFRYANSSNYYYAKVDDIVITLDEGCMTPTNVTATPDSITSDVTVTWTNPGSLSDFVVVYRENGDGDWSAPLATSTTSKTLTGLNYASSYEIRVGQVCGLDTLWSTSVSVATTCGLINVPYVENFVSATGTLPPCWNYTNESYFHWNRWTTHAETSGDGEMMVSTGSAGEAAILPYFYAPFIKLQISFKAKLGNVSEGDGIMMGAYDETTGTVEWLDTLTNPSQSRENFVVFTYNYLNYNGYGTRIAIGHSHNNASDWGFALDSIVVIELASCNPPENLTAHNTLYPNTADDVFFTWTVSGSESDQPANYQLYFDTITSTIDIDSVPESMLITVDTNFYQPAPNTLAEGAHYRLFVRSDCGGLHSDWVQLQNGFTTDEFWMNNSATFDTIIGCDFVIYDNGGPVAGYLHNSNSNLVIEAGEAGRELQLQGAFFSHGADANTFTVYDGIGTAGEVLYTRNVTNATETIDSVLATSTTGAMTITFTSGYYAALGYELYIHCVGEASCTKPTNLQVEMVDNGTAYATWDSTGASLYRVYHHVNGDSVWNMNPTYTNSITLSGLPADVNYDFYVVAYCSATDTSAPSIIRHFNTHYVEPCYMPENLQVNAISQTTAEVSWTSTGTQWEVALVGGATVTTTSNPYTLTGLTANTQYSVRVRNICDSAEGRISDWTDTVTFTTLPVPEVNYTITVVSNNDAWGTVTGSGTYAEGSSVDITASANEGYHFVKWQEDNNTSANRTITVTADATYTAIFEVNTTGIDDVESGNVTLFPNPASTMVTIRGIEGMSQVTVVDLNGREVFKANADNSLTIDLSGFAKGAYFVRITGERTSAVQKLIVK